MASSSQGGSLRPWGRQRLHPRAGQICQKRSRARRVVPASSTTRSGARCCSSCCQCWLDVPLPITRVLIAWRRCQDSSCATVVFASTTQASCTSPRLQSANTSPHLLRPGSMAATIPLRGDWDGSVTAAWLGWLRDCADGLNAHEHSISRVASPNRHGL